MKRELVETEDGSHSLYVPELDERYHSCHGALSESRHVFIAMGLKAFPENQDLRILEIGFGTGLNAWLTWLEMDVRQKLTYIALEAYPLELSEVQVLNYSDLFVRPDGPARFIALHETPWEEAIEMGPGFVLEKRCLLLQDFELSDPVDLIYFDAFAPDKQPELWTEAVFQKMADLLRPGGRLLTYCAKGAVRRKMQSVGLEVERLAGPPGKREMLGARKPG